MSEKTIQHITYSFDTDISAAPEHVWNTLINRIGEWWLPDFFVNQEHKDIKLEPHIGGRLFEQPNSGPSVLWATVIAMEPGKSLDLLGHLTQDWGGPTTNFLRFTVEQNGDRATVTFRENVMGYLSADSKDMMEEGWKGLTGSLKNLCEA